MELYGRVRHAVIVQDMSRREAARVILMEGHQSALSLIVLVSTEFSLHDVDCFLVGRQRFCLRPFRYIFHSHRNHNGRHTENYR